MLPSRCMTTRFRVLLIYPCRDNTSQVRTQFSQERIHGLLVWPFKVRYVRAGVQRHRDARLAHTRLGRPADRQREPRGHRLRLAGRPRGDHRDGDQRLARLPDCGPVPEPQREGRDGRLLPVHGARPLAGPCRRDLRVGGRAGVAPDSDRRARRHAQARLRATRQDRHERAPAAPAAEPVAMAAARVAHPAGEPRLPVRLRVLLHRAHARAHDAVQDARVDRGRARANLPERPDGPARGAADLLRRRQYLRQPAAVQGHLPRHHRAQQALPEVQAALRLAAHRQRVEGQGSPRPDARSGLLQHVHRPREHERRGPQVLPQAAQPGVRLRRGDRAGARIRDGSDRQFHLRHRRRRPRVLRARLRFLRPQQHPVPGTSTSSRPSATSGSAT